MRMKEIFIFILNYSIVGTVLENEMLLKSYANNKFTKAKNHFTYQI